jgi:hypothetical protein
MNPNNCARCGWHWFKHGSKNQCPNSPRNADGSKPRFMRTALED